MNITIINGKGICSKTLTALEEEIYNTPDEEINIKYLSKKHKKCPSVTKTIVERVKRYKCAQGNWAQEYNIVKEMLTKKSCTMKELKEKTSVTPKTIKKYAEMENLSNKILRERAEKKAGKVKEKTSPVEINGIKIKTVKGYRMRPFTKIEIDVLERINRGEKKIGASVAKKYGKHRQQIYPIIERMNGYKKQIEFEKGKKNDGKNEN